jgi:hypothetical protein
MMSISKIFWVIIVSLSLIAFAGHKALLMASSSQGHATHFVSLKGPQLAQEEVGCYVCHADGGQQCGEGAPFFRSGIDVNDDEKYDLSETDVCNPCHSPNGVAMAKANWQTGVYTSQYEEFPLWQQTTDYETGDIVMHGDPALMYAAKSTFTSDDNAFLADNWTEIKPLSYVYTYGHRIGDLIEYNGEVYRSGVEHLPFCSPGDVDPANWELVERTGTGNDLLQAGKENWCATCHDAQPAYSKHDPVDFTGVHAPQILGDGTTYGFYVSGHGRPGIDQQCLDCHNSTFPHIDHNHRTYEMENPSFVKHAYKDSYRLKEGMRIPTFKYDDESILQAMENCYDLCSKACHETHAGVLSDPQSCQTNFREGSNYTQQYHEYHLSFISLGQWDSDWDGVELDSAMNCPACHNVHGSPMMVNGTLKPNPVMIRHGELISTPGSEPLDKVPAIDFRWFVTYQKPRVCGVNETNILEQSRGGDMCGSKVFSENYVCVTCHGDGYNRIPDCDAGIVDESFEGAGYQEAPWTETIGDGCSLDKDYSPLPGTNPPDTGSECLRLVSDAPSYQAMTNLEYVIPQQTTFTSFYFMVEAEGLANGQKKTIGSLRNDAGSAAWGFMLYKYEDQLKFNVYLYNIGVWNQAYYDILPNTWYNIMVSYDDAWDSWQWWVDDVSQNWGTLSGDHRTNIQNWTFGFEDPAQDRTATVYFDKITVHTEYPD